MSKTNPMSQETKRTIVICAALVLGVLAFFAFCIVLCFHVSRNDHQREGDSHAVKIACVQAGGTPLDGTCYHLAVVAK